MAVGGFNGTDPSPTLEEFIRYVDEGRIHYFIKGRMMMGRSGGWQRGETAAVADWVEARYSAQTVDGAVIYDLTRAADISQPAHSSGQR